MQNESLVVMKLLPQRFPISSTEHFRRDNAPMFSACSLAKWPKNVFYLMQLQNCFCCPAAGFQ